MHDLLIRSSFNGWPGREGCRRICLDTAGKNAASELGSHSRVLALSENPRKTAFYNHPRSYSINRAAGIPESEEQRLRRDQRDSTNRNISTRSVSPLDEDIVLVLALIVTLERILTDRKK